MADSREGGNEVTGFIEGSVMLGRADVGFPRRNLLHAFRYVLSFLFLGRLDILF
jgi:hypothetical protein